MQLAAPPIRFAAAAGAPAPPPPAPFEDDDALPSEALASPVLIVEDEMMIAWRMQDLFEDFGFTDVRTAPDFDAALAAAGQRVPGLLVCDINLGDGPDGVATAQALRAEAAIPTVFITGYAGAELTARIAEAAPDAALLHKPIEAEQLRTVLTRCLVRTRH